jgi:hypothetical protein
MQCKCKEVTHPLPQSVRNAGFLLTEPIVVRNANAVNILFNNTSPQTFPTLSSWKNLHNCSRVKLTKPQLKCKPQRRSDFELTLNIPTHTIQWLLQGKRQDDEHLFYGVLDYDARGDCMLGLHNGLLKAIATVL